MIYYLNQQIKSTSEKSEVSESLNDPISSSTNPQNPINSSIVNKQTNKFERRVPAYTAPSYTNINESLREGDIKIAGPKDKETNKEVKLQERSELTMSGGSFLFTESYKNQVIIKI